jgi:hypothetical protein
MTTTTDTSKAAQVKPKIPKPRLVRYTTEKAMLIFPEGGWVNTLNLRVTESQQFSTDVIEAGARIGEILMVFQLSELKRRSP